MRARHKQGFSVPELVVVAAVIALVAAIVIAAFSNFGQFFALRTATQDVQLALIDARSATLGAKSDTVHGVHIETTGVTRFVGPTYNAAATTNTSFPFSSGVTATWTLEGGGDDVVFTRLTGTTQSSGTITVTEPRSGESRTITVESSGLVVY